MEWHHLHVVVLQRHPQPVLCASQATMVGSSPGAELGPKSGPNGRHWPSRNARSRYMLRGCVVRSFLPAAQQRERAQRRCAWSTPCAGPLSLTSTTFASSHQGPLRALRGQEGVRQQRVSVVNACGLARGFLDEGIDVVLSDVLNRDTADLYRQLLPNVLIIELGLPIAEARRRAALRRAHLTADEFDALHALQATLDLGVDHIVDVGPMTLDQQVTAVLHLWKS